MNYMRLVRHWSSRTFGCLLLLGVLLFAQTADRFEVCGGAKGRPCTCLRRMERIKARQVDDCKAAAVSDTVCQTLLPFDDCRLVEWGEPAEDRQPDMADFCLRVCKPHDCKCGDKATCHVLHKISDHEKPKGKK